MIKAIFMVTDFFTDVNLQRKGMLGFDISVILQQPTLLTEKLNREF